MNLNRMQGRAPKSIQDNTNQKHFLELECLFLKLQVQETNWEEIVSVENQITVWKVKWKYFINDVEFIRN